MRVGRLVLSSYASERQQIGRRVLPRILGRLGSEMRLEVLGNSVVPRGALIEL